MTQHSSPSFVDRIKETMASRRSEYAHPQDNHQLTADLFELWWKAKCQYRLERDQYGPGGRMPFTAEDICIFNIFQKLSRIAFATHDDSLLDIVGYAENIAMLAQEQRNNIGPTAKERLEKFTGPAPQVGERGPEITALHDNMLCPGGTFANEMAIKEFAIRVIDLLDQAKFPESEKDPEYIGVSVAQQEVVKLRAMALDLGLIKG